MEKSMKIAVIGAGAMGRQHVKAWKLAGHEVVSIADLDMKLSKKLAEEFGVEKIYGDYRKAVEDPSIDIVSICLPLAMHAPVTVYAAENGKHIFCEKPLARSFEEVAQMEAGKKSRCPIRYWISTQFCQQ
jgi:predicted dehydrogenase